MESINKFVPVLELSDFLSLKGRILDVVYYLQGYKAGPRYSTRKFFERGFLIFSFYGPDALTTAVHLD